MKIECSCTLYLDKPAWIIIILFRMRVPSYPSSSYTLRIMGLTNTYITFASTHKLSSFAKQYCFEHFQSPCNPKSSFCYFLVDIFQANILDQTLWICPTQYFHHARRFYINLIKLLISTHTHQLNFILLSTYNQVVCRLLFTLLLLSSYYTPM